MEVKVKLFMMVMKLSLVFLKTGNPFSLAAVNLTRRDDFQRFLSFNENEKSTDFVSVSNSSVL